MLLDISIFHLAGQDMVKFVMLISMFYAVRHIYVPLGGSRHGQVRRLFASLMCFAYVCLWHGMSSNVLFWVVANFIGISLEAFGDQLASSAHIRQLEVDFVFCNNLM